VTLSVVDVMLQLEGPHETTVEDRCPECGWTLYGAMYGDVYCIKPDCCQFRLNIFAPADAADGVDSPPSTDNDNESENDT
jgi:hypothetical protein